MEPAELREIVEILATARWDYASIVTDAYTLTVGAPPQQLFAAASSTSPAAEQPPKAAPADATMSASVPPVPPQVLTTSTSSVTGTGTQILAQSVGVIWRAPKPGAPPFVEVGQNVEEGETLAVLEVMKLFSPVKATVAGLITSILIENGDMVEHGTPLFTVSTDGQQ